jgi:hypothetical protein
MSLGQNLYFERKKKHKLAKKWVFSRNLVFPDNYSVIRVLSAGIGNLPYIVKHSALGFTMYSQENNFTPVAKQSSGSLIKIITTVNQRLSLLAL